MAELTDVLVVAPDVVRRSADADGAIFWWPGTGREVRVGRTSARLLALFAIPTTVGAVAAELDAVDGERHRTLLGSLEALRERELLRPYEQPAPSSVAIRTGLFGAPVTDLAGALRGDTAHGVVIGVPYDAGVTYRAGARFAPEYLRRVSTGLFRTGRTGMVDPVTGRRVLDGVRLVDVGDLVEPVPTRNGPMLASLADAVAAIVAAGRVPIVLGGDHSITLPVVDGITRAHSGIGVIHLDAHHDYGQARVSDRQDAHHGNFLDWVVGNDAVECVAQFGIRQLTAEPPERSPKLRGWPGRTAVTTPLDEIVAGLPSGLRWHVTIDIDVLDPSVLSSTGTLLPGGYSHTETVALLAGLCSRLDVVGVDLVELIGSPSEAPGIIAADVLLRTIDAVFSRRSTP